MKVFKVKPLKTPRPDVPSKKTAYNLFCKDIRKIKNEFQGVPDSNASVIISEERKKVKTRDKKLKKYSDIYEEEKRRHEEDLQRYQKDHMDEMEIINLHKRSKARKILQPQKAPNSPKSDEPKKSPRSSDEKKTATKAEKKTIRQPKKAPKSPEFIETDDSSKEEEKEPKKALSLLMTQARKNKKCLKKGQVMEKTPLQKKCPQNWVPPFFKGAA